MLLISRSSARNLGQKRYYTGRPCSKGHVSERYVFNCACVECIRLRTLGRMRDERKELRELRARVAQLSSAA
jgi:hypothetical protein